MNLSCLDDLASSTKWILSVRLGCYFVWLCLVSIARSCDGVQACTSQHRLLVLNIFAMGVIIFPLVVVGWIRSQGYSVAFDPLDGSSIIDTNFAVGTIFGVWPGSRLVGVSGRDLAGAGMAVYGPRTTMTVAGTCALRFRDACVRTHPWQRCPLSGKAAVCLSFCLGSVRFDSERSSSLSQPSCGLSGLFRRFSGRHGRLPRIPAHR